MPVELLATRNYKAGYVVKTQRYSGQHYGVPEGQAFDMKTAYTPDGKYIGQPRMAHLLVVKRGIKPELRTEDSGTCTIGFCEREQKWYGWSHRAIAGFGIGDRLFEEDYPGADDHTPFVEHGSIVIENMEQARQAAANFAESVS